MRSSSWPRSYSRLLPLRRQRQGKSDFLEGRNIERSLTLNLDWEVIHRRKKGVWGAGCGEDQEFCVLPLCTCRPSGFQRTFLSRAGVELSVFWGLFFSVRITPHGSSLRALTRFLSCQPTCGTQTAGYKSDCGKHTRAHPAQKWTSQPHTHPDVSCQ